jgi:DNA-binding transcriptional LysR family regulator
MRTMDLDDLDIFRCVVREGGITRAATRLHRVPSNVTTRIKQFEERLGVPLFRRQGRSLALTDAGRALLVHAERLLQIANEAEQDIRSGVVRGGLRIGSLESTAGVRLPPVLSSFHARYPDVSIELQTATTGALLERLQAFEFEAAFVSEPFEKGRLSSRVVFVEELVLITATSDAPPRRASDLNGRTLVAFPHGCSYRRRLLEWVAEAGFSAGRTLELASYHAIVACVAAGAGVAIVPAQVLDQTVAGSAVARHPLPARLRVNRTHLVWFGDPSVPLRALLELLPSPSSPTRASR